MNGIVVSTHALRRYVQRVSGPASAPGAERELLDLWENGMPVTHQMVDALGQLARPGTEYRVCYDRHGRQLLLPVQGNTLVTVVRIGRRPKAARRRGDMGS